jgi:MoaA/NifB/PqqE/SkfB family radical SAM enzyme
MIKKYTDFVNEKVLNLEQDGMLETIKNPNFSIVLPGKCNGNCGFCFWKESSACENYIQNLKETINNLPEQFYQLSLTGGEPTLSPYFSDILENIDTDRWLNTVLTTNGVNLKKFIHQLEGKIQHVNISRHHYDDKINESIFESKSVPSANFLKKLVKELNDVGIDVTYSAVITEHLNNKDEIKKFIKFAKSHGVNQVFFRKQHGTLDPSEAEKAFEHLPQEHHNCPVCRNTTQHINETKVVWKASLEEPSKELGMIYELVYNQNGKLTSDWEQELIVESTKIKSNPQSLLEECGGGSYSGCGGSSSPESSYSGCGSSGYSGCGSSDSYSSEPTEEELRLAKLKERDIKVKKVLKKVKKELAIDRLEDTKREYGFTKPTTSTDDVDVNYEIKK